MKDAYCDRCKARMLVRTNATQVRCSKCGAFLFRRRRDGTVLPAHPFPFVPRGIPA